MKWIWNRDAVEERVLEAADVLRRLPEERVRGFFNTWPDMMVEFSDMVGRVDEPMKLPPPHPRAISRMEETITWSKFLEPEDAKLLWRALSKLLGRRFAGASGFHAQRQIAAMNTRFV